ncbi:hypothetical protein Gotur_016877 [Gossypium turneri]
MGSVSAWPEGVPTSNKERVRKELVNGQECAKQLQILLHNWCEKNGRLSAEELVHKIFASFDHALSLLTSVESAEDSQNQATSYDDSPCCNGRSEDSTNSRKKLPSKEKRGCYKRRRDEHARTVVSSTVEDGHAWRKYGQKQILNSKHPRSYFRCTRKYDQGCKATKQVQRLEDAGSQMFQTTYIGTHTCRPDSFKAPQIIIDSEPRESYNKFSYGSSNPKIPTKKLHEITPPVKQETKEETPTTSGLTDMDSVVMWKDIIGAEYGDVVSNVYTSTEITSQNLELDLVMKPVEFEDDFQFDESEFV